MAKQPRAAPTQSRRPDEEEGTFGEVDVQRVGLFPQEGIPPLGKRLKQGPQRIEGVAALGCRRVAEALAAPELVQELRQALFSSLHAFDFGFQGDRGVLKLCAAGARPRTGGLCLPQLEVEEHHHGAANRSGDEQQRERGTSPAAASLRARHPWRDSHRGEFT